MKSLILSTGLALGLGALAFAPANAAPMAHATVLAPTAQTDVACRTVKKITYAHGMKKVVTSQQCDRDARVVVRPAYGYGYGRPYHRDPRPGVRIGVGIR